jgi:hypothetical protein
LITNCKRHTSEKSANFRACLGETKNIVDKEKYIFTFLIAEIFSNCLNRKTNTGDELRGFVHLPED